MSRYIQNVIHFVGVKNHTFDNKTVFWHSCLVEDKLQLIQDLGKDICHHKAILPYSQTNNNYIQEWVDSDADKFVILDTYDKTVRRITSKTLIPSVQDFSVDYTMKFEPREVNRIWVSFWSAKTPEEISIIPYMKQIRDESSSRTNSIALRLWRMQEA